MFNIVRLCAHFGVIVLLCLVGQQGTPELKVEARQDVLSGLLECFDVEAFEVAEYLSYRIPFRSDLELLQLSQLIIEKSAEIGVDPTVLLAVIDVESTYNACALSRVGAKGLMQVMPYRILGREEASKLFAFNSHLIYDPYWNIAFGAQYLGELIQRFDSLETALTAYNMGPTRVAQILDEDGFVSNRYANRVFRRVRVIETQVNI